MKKRICVEVQMPTTCGFKEMIVFHKQGDQDFFYHILLSLEV
jgi:hypothetical protein